jgi:hypothetical protein
MPDSENETRAQQLIGDFAPRLVSHRRWSLRRMVELSTAPKLPGQTSRAIGALPRGRRSVWPSRRTRIMAVAFTDTESVICCLRDVRFAVRLQSAWPIY